MKYSIKILVIRQVVGIAVAAAVTGLAKYAGAQGAQIIVDHVWEAVATLVAAIWSIDLTAFYQAKKESERL